MVYWITGRKNAGKTTEAKRIQQKFWDNDHHWVPIIDGDDFRDNVIDLGYKEYGRYLNIMLMARIAALLERQGGTVIVACVSPRKEWRDKARELFRRSELIYVPGGELWPGTTYEEPDEEEQKERFRDAGV